MFTLNTTTDASRIRGTISAVDRRLDASIQRLSSGVQVQSAKDNAAGLAISQRLSSQIRGITMAQRNSADAIQLLSTAEGATQEIANALQRMRELAVQALNGTYNDAQRSALNSEFQGLKSEIVAISKRTTWNGMRVLSNPQMPVVTKTSTYIEYSGYGSTSETLSLSSAATPNTATRAISVVSGKVFVGTGRSAYQLGEVDSTLNGVAGKPLRINYVSQINPSTQFQNPTNGHYYEVVLTSGVTWAEAKADAESRRLFGMPGYLATLSGQDEQNFINSKLAGKEGWIGASDQQSESDWKWVTGPESGTTFYNGRWGAGATVAGQFSNWDIGEPNDLAGEDYAYIKGNGRWNDFGISTRVPAYVVEYGGSGVDPSLIPADSDLNALASAVTYTDTDARNRTIDLVIQIGADADQVLSISLKDFSDKGDVTSAITGDFESAPSAQTVTIRNRQGAEQVLSKLDAAISNVLAARSSMGSYLTALNAVLDRLVTSTVDLNSSRSVIMDTDYAQETAAVAKEQALLSASQTILGRAHFTQEMVLKLLGTSR